MLLNDSRAPWNDVSAAALAEVDRAIKSVWLVLGEELEGFEEALALHWELPPAVGCASDLDALEVALRGLHLPPGTPVLTTSSSATFRERQELTVLEDPRTLCSWSLPRSVTTLPTTFAITTIFDARSNLPATETRRAELASDD